MVSAVDIMLASVRSLQWLVMEAWRAGCATLEGAVVFLEAHLPSWVFLTLQSLVLTWLALSIFVAFIVVAWTLLWKLVLSKVRFIVALRNELLLGQPAKPQARAHPHSHHD